MTEPNDGAAAAPPSAEDATPKSTPHSNRTGWDGKLRLNSEKQAVLANPEALEDSDYEDEDAPPVDEIAADEGGLGVSGEEYFGTKVLRRGLLQICLMRRIRIRRYVESRTIAVLPKFVKLETDHVA